ncbi:MAG TPA: hypothetical protein PLS67_06265 [Accumulibacter sp.]|nr:hypothetical protein [Accumulibacter sp.]
MNKEDVHVDGFCAFFNDTLPSARTSAAVDSSRMPCIPRKRIIALALLGRYIPVGQV